jgi:hypothetical protein
VSFCHPTGAVRIPAGWAEITGAGLDPSGTPVGFPSNGSGGEGCWGETADAEPNVVVKVARVVAVPVGRAAVVGFVEPGAAAQQLGLHQLGVASWAGLMNPDLAQGILLHQLRRAYLMASQIHPAFLNAVFRQHFSDPENLVVHPR